MTPIDNKVFIYYDVMDVIHELLSLNKLVIS